MKIACFKLLLFLLFQLSFNQTKASFCNLFPGERNGGVLISSEESFGSLYSDNETSSVTGGVVISSPADAPAPLDVTISETITLSSITSSPICQGSIISVPVTTTGTFNSGNSFKVQLSNSSGSFSSPTQIGSASTITGGAISSTIPGSVSGSGYKVRVVSTSPVVYSNEIPLTINANPTPASISVTPAGDICAGTSFTVNVNYGIGNTTQSTSFPTYTSPNGTSGSGWFAFSATMGNTSGNIVIVNKNSAGCTSTATRPVNVIPLPSNPIFIDSISSLKICSGESISVPYTINGCSFSSTNIFKVQLSNASGSFASPTTIGSVTSNTSGQITATIPAGIATGTNYRIRITSTFPFITSSEYPFSFDITNDCGGLTFDGSNDRAIVPYNSAYNLGTGDFTIEAWIKPTSYNNVPILSNRSTSHANTFMFMLYGPQTLLIQVNGINYTCYLFNSILDGNCHHVAVVRNGSTSTFYVDGVLENTNSIAGSITATNNLTIGYDTPNNTSFQGDINEVRFWNIARTSTEISTNKSSVLTTGTTNLIGYWKFREVVGEAILDGSSIAGHGYLGTNPSISDAANPLRSNGACFSGDRIASDYHETIFFADSNLVSLEATIYPNPFQKETNIIVNGIGNNKNQVEIINMQGNSEGKFEVENNIPFTLGKELPQGVYFIQIVSENKKIIKKVVKID